MRTIAGMNRKLFRKYPKSDVSKKSRENPSDGRVNDPVSPASCLTVA
jgi:hypothetical protein